MYVQYSFTFWNQKDSERTGRSESSSGGDDDVLGDLSKRLMGGILGVY